MDERALEFHRRAAEQRGTSCGTAGNELWNELWITADELVERVVDGAPPVSGARARTGNRAEAGLLQRRQRSLDTRSLALCLLRSEQRGDLGKLLLEGQPFSVHLAVACLQRGDVGGIEEGEPWRRWR